MLVNYPQNRTILPERYRPSFPSPFCLEIKTSALYLAGLLWKVCPESVLREISTSGMTHEGGYSWRLFHIRHLETMSPVSSHFPQNKPHKVSADRIDRGNWWPWLTERSRRIHILSSFRLCPRSHSDPTIRGKL